jgi:protein-disulfide isomerase
LTVEPELIECYVRSGVVRLVFRDVLNHGDRSRRASEAAACAGAQEHFWAMHRLLFERQDALWSAAPDALPDLLVGYAGEIAGLGVEQFGACLIGRETLAQLEAADAEQRARGIVSQPIFEVGDARLVGLQSVEALSAAIDAALP